MKALIKALKDLAKNLRREAKTFYDSGSTFVVKPTGLRLSLGCFKMSKEKLGG
jgi:hypothetical protein